MPASVFRVKGTGRVGRPKASSKETLAEAACELFLERGFEATSIADITARAGVSRSSFFNYFASKSDILWAGFDERLAAFEKLLAVDEGTDAASSVRAAVLAVGSAFTPDSLALAIVNATAMGLETELARETAVRRTRIARVVSERLSRGGADRLRAEVAGAAWGGAVLAAVEAWAHDGAGVTSLKRFLSRAADAAGSIGSAPAAGDVRQLRVVRVEQDDVDPGYQQALLALEFPQLVLGQPGTHRWLEAVHRD